MRDKEKKKASNKAWRKTNSERVRNYQKAWHRANSKRDKASALLRQYGLTLDAFDSMLTGQGGVCAICGKNDWGKKGPCVDHTSGSGHEAVVRGILCVRCNAAIGLLKENPGIVRAAAGYLERSK